jgi:hypothetical protein
MVQQNLIQGACNTISGHNMRGLSKKFSTYPRELLFVLRNSVDWHTCAVLLENIALFHVGNAFGRRSGSDLPFTARLHFGIGHSAEIVITPFSGDLFVISRLLTVRR